MAAIKEYKCPCCGGAVEFDSKMLWNLTVKFRR